MFSRSLTALARRRPPFAIFFKSMVGTLSPIAAPERMKVAGALWRRTSPRYGIRYSAPRVAAAKQIYQREGHSLVKSATETTKASRRTRKPKAVKHHRKRRAVTATKNAKRAKRRNTSGKRRKGRKAMSHAKPAKAATTPYASFTAKVLKQAKLPATATNRRRVFRMWLLTGQQRSLSLSKRVSMAVRLLTKGQKSKRRLSKRALRKKSTNMQKRRTASKHRHSKARKGTAKKVKKVKRSARKSAAAKKTSTAPKLRLAPRKTSKARRVRKSASTTMNKRRQKSKAVRAVRTSTHPKPPEAASAKKAKVRKAAVRKPKVKTPRKVRKVVAKPKVRRAVAKKRSSAKRRRNNPYIEFYRRMRMTGLLPNGPVVVGSRKIKKLWAATHALPNIDARVAQATKILEQQTGRKALTATAATPNSAARATRKAVVSGSVAGPATVTMKDIKVPRYYPKNPFEATYAALLPALQDIPSSTRMAHVAKAWTNTERKDDHRSAKQRIAAVAQELKK